MNVYIIAKIYKNLLDTIDIVIDIIKAHLLIMRVMYTRAHRSFEFATEAVSPDGYSLCIALIPCFD